MVLPWNPVQSRHYRNQRFAETGMTSRLTVNDLARPLGYMNRLSPASHSFWHASTKPTEGPE